MRTVSKALGEAAPATGEGELGAKGAPHPGLVSGPGISMMGSYHINRDPGQGLVLGGKIGISYWT